MLGILLLVFFSIHIRIFISNSNLLINKQDFIDYHLDFVFVVFFAEDPLSIFLRKHLEPRLEYIFLASVCLPLLTLSARKNVQKKLSMKHKICNYLFCSNGIQDNVRRFRSGSIPNLTFDFSINRWNNDSSFWCNSWCIKCL